MSLPADAGFREATTRSHSYAIECWVLDANGGQLQRVEVLESSSIQVGTGLVRRTASINLPARAEYIPAQGGLIWWDHPLLLRFGADGLWCEMPLLWPDEPEYETGSQTINLGCHDAMRIIGADTKLAATFALADDTGIGTAIRRLLVLAGAPDDDAYHDHDDGGATFLGGATYEAGTLVGAILDQWMTDYQLDIYAGPPAVYTTRPIPDPLTQDPVATWALGREVKLLGFRKSWRNRAKNHAIVEGLDPNGMPFRVEVFDTNPESPVQWGSPGVPDLVVEHRSDGIRSLDQAEDVGRSLLVSGRVEEEVAAMVPVDPSLDRRDVVRIEESGSDTAGTFMLEEFAVPLAPVGHSVTVRRERTLE